MRKKDICGGRKEIEECHKDDNEDLPAGRKKNAHKKKGPKKNAAPHTYAGTAFQRKEKTMYIYKVYQSDHTLCTGHVTDGECA